MLDVDLLDVDALLLGAALVDVDCVEVDLAGGDPVVPERRWVARALVALDDAVRPGVRPEAADRGESRFGLAGTGSDNQRPNLRPRDCRCRTAAGSCRAQLAKMPIANIVTTSEVPPEEISGKVIPVTGSRPTT